MKDDLMFTTSISAIKKNNIRLGIWIKKEFETEKVKHYLVDICIEEEKLLTVYENACIGLDISLIDSNTEDGRKYRDKVFDILLSDKVIKYIENNGYFNNIVYVDGNVIKEQYQSMDKILMVIRDEYPLKVRTKKLTKDDDRSETLRLQFEDSNNETVEESLKDNK